MASSSRRGWNQWLYVCAIGRPQRPYARSNVHEPGHLAMAHVAVEQRVQTGQQRFGHHVYGEGRAWLGEGATLLHKEKRGAKLVHFPPHWMISWPVGSKTSGFPSCAKDPETIARAGNSCIAEDGSPAAFLVIYQDPAKLKFK